MSSFPGSKSAGFTLIELMIGVAILGTIIAMGMPSFKQMLRNSQVRGTAESFANGVQRARAEAVAHNARVQFVLNSDTSWFVDYVTTPNPAARLDTMVTTTTLTAITRLPAGATTITFNQLGQVVSPNPDGTLPLTQITVTGTGGNLTLLVKIGAGGSARVCDPDPGMPASNLRSCSHA